jgi:nitrite reductase/ring-hydroxylating ferredoxin subunit
MDDACPHRLAPLSEGRIVLPLPSKQEKNNNKNKDDAESSSSSASIGDIQCSYHGWSFNSDGQCTSIPQASPDVERAALSGKQCNVPTYSTIIDRSIIWFWPWKQDVIEATINAAAAATNKDDGAASPGGGWDITPSGLMKGCPPADLPNTYTRELPYSYDILVENLLDPSHVPFAHHGLQGSRSDAIPIEMSLPTSDGITERGFTFEWTDRTMGMMRNGEGRWQAPYTVLYDAKFYEQDPPRDFNLAVLCVPVRAGWSRAILFGPGGKNSTSSDSDSSSTIDKDVGSVAEADSSITDEKTRQSSSFKTTLIKAIFAAIPIWIVHQLNNKFLDSDLAFLHYQDLERSRRQQVSAAAASSVSNRKDDYYFMPAASDRCIAALRSWFAKYTDLSALGPVTVELSRVEMFNRWSQHTSKCVHCQNGLKQLAKARKILFGITALSAVGFNASILAKAAFFISLTLQPFISKIEQSMMEGEFKHYENH